MLSPAPQPGQPSTARVRVIVRTAAALAVFVAGALSLNAIGETWTPAASMSKPRHEHSATRLADGRVLVAGGWDAGLASPDIEIYNVATNTWAPGPAMVEGRAGQTATMLTDGRVLVTGGWILAGHSSTKSAEVYNPATNSWSSTPDMAFPRAVHRATLLADGRVLVTGGYTPNADPFQGYASSAEIFDPQSNSWTVVASMNIRRVAHVAVALPDGRVLVAGGANFARYERTAELYNPATNAWSFAPDMSTERYWGGAVLLGSGRVLMTGGSFFNPQSTAEIFDPSTNGWQPTGSMSAARSFLTLTSLADGRVMAIGGQNGATANASADIYDPNMGTWSPTPALISARYYHTSSLLLDGRVLAVGGSDNSNSLATAEVWGVHTATTTEVLPTSGPLNGTATLTATLKVGGVGVPNQSVAFSILGSPKGSAVTDSFGTASLLASLTDVPAGSHIGGIHATFAGAPGYSGSTGQGDLVVDPTPPVITPFISGTAGLGGWYRSDVSVSWTVDDPETTITTTTGCGPVIINADTPGADITCSATSAGGTGSQTVTIRRDTVGPAINVNAPTEQSHFLHAAVPASYLCLDGLSGVASCTGSVPNGANIDTATLGSKSFSVAAMDLAGNPAGDSVTYTVVKVPGAQYAYSPDSSGSRVLIADVSTRTLVGAIAGIAGQPWWIAMAPDGHRAYVTSPAANRVTVIDLDTDTVAATIAVPADPQGLAVSSDGSKVYVACRFDSAVTIIDAASNTVAGRIPTGGSPFGVALSPAGTKAYVTNEGQNTVAVIDLTSNTTIGQIPVSLKPQGVVFTTDGTRAFVANQFTGSLSVIDAGTDIAAPPQGVVSNAHSLALSPDNTRLYVVGAEPGGPLAVVDTATMSVVWTLVGSGIYPGDADVTADGELLVVAGAGAGAINFYRTSTNTLAGTLSIPGSNTIGMALRPVPQQTTTLSVEPSSGVYGGTTNLAATLTRNGSPVVGRPVRFSVDDVFAGTAVTDASGLATLTAVGLAGLSAGVHANAVFVEFLGAPGLAGTTAIEDLTITPAMPVITWPAPSPIIFGTPLGAAQLNATANVPGTFVYSPDIGTVLNAGAHVLSATFVPADANYATASATASLTVMQATPLLTWPNVASIPYGTALNASQLNATASVPGAFTYTPAAATVLAVGTHTLSAAFAPADTVNFTGAAISTSLTVTRATPRVSVNSVTVPVGDGPEGVAINPNSGLAYVSNKASDTLSVIDADPDRPTFAQVVGTIAGFPAPRGMAVNPVTNRLYVTNEQLNVSVVDVDPASPTFHTILTTVYVNNWSSWGIAVNPTTNTIYTGNEVAFAAKAISGTTNSVMANIAACGPYGVAVNPVTSRAYVTNAWCGNTSVIDIDPASPTYHQVLTSFASGGIPNVAVNPTTNLIYVTDSDNSRVSVRDGATNGQLAQIAVNSRPYAVTVDPIANLAFVSLSGTASVAVLDGRPASPTFNTIIGTLDVGQTPIGLAADSDTGVVIVANQGDDSVTIMSRPEIVYGTPLDATHFNATSSAPGTFSYAPALGTILPVGVHVISATLTPTDSASYDTAVGVGLLRVRKRTPLITWATPASVTYGTALGGAQLNATADIPGTFAYSPMAGTVLGAGTHVLSVTFTPADAANHETATASVSLQVLQGSAGLTWAAPAAITFGTPLGGAQLNAIAAIPGSFSYTPVAGTVLNAGTHQLDVAFAPADAANYAPAGASVTLTVNKASTTVSYITARATTTGVGDFSARLRSNGVGLAGKLITFTVSGQAVGQATTGADGIATLAGVPTVALPAGTHSYLVTFTFAGDENYQPSELLNGPLQVGQEPDVFAWTMATSAAAPQPRSGHKIVYDSGRNRIVLFGGRALDGTFLNDIWEFETATSTWTNVTPEGGAMPIGRSFFGMAYDPPRNQIIVYGGAVSSAYSNVGVTGDTWVWDCASRTWTQTSASTIASVGLIGAELAFSPVGQRVILFGGEPYWITPNNGTTYGWTGTTWTPLTSAGPEGRIQHVMSTDTHRGRVVLFGGHTDNTWPLGTTRSDTWEWDGSSWTLMAPEGAGPPAPHSAGFAYDAARRVHVLFGGILSNETWEWTGVRWTRRTAVAQPSSRATTIAYDESRDRLVLFGGNSSAGPSFYNVLNLGGAPAAGLGDTWIGEAIVKQATTITTAGTGTYGAPATLTATLTTGVTPLAGTSIDFTLNGVPVGSAVTDAQGLATLPNVSLAGVNAGTHAAAIHATFTSDLRYHGSAADGDLAVSKATAVIVWAAPADIVDGTALGGAQLNAIADTSGTFDYTPAAGTVLAVGTHTLAVTFAPADGANYTGASSSVSITVLANRAELVVISGSASPLVVQPGDMPSITDTVENRGFVAAGTSRTRFYLSLNLVKDAGDIQLNGNRLVPGLAPGTASTGVSTPGIPGSTPLGTYRLIACADDLTSVNEIDETNNCAVIVADLTVTRPDLVTSAVGDPPHIAQPGSGFVLGDIVLNAGALPVTQTTSRYYLSVDQMIDAGDRRLTGSRAVPGLAAGAGSSGTATLTIPNNVVLGTYYVLACADDMTSVNESDEGNNCRASGAIVVVTRPDLTTIAASTSATVVQPGDAISVSDTASNQGGFDAGASTTRYYVSPTPQRGAGDKQLNGTRSVPALAVGQNSAGTVTVVVPTGTALGTYYLLACADDKNDVDETDETNNCKPTGATVVVTRPDLVVATLADPPTSIGPGGSFVVAVSIANVGAVNAAPSTVRYYFSKVPVRGDASERRLNGVSNLGVWPAFVSAGFTVSLGVPGNMAPGSYFLIACADDTTNITELNEMNNCRASSTKVIVQ